MLEMVQHIYQCKSHRAFPLKKKSYIQNIVCAPVSIMYEWKEHQEPSCTAKSCNSVCVSPPSPRVAETQQRHQVALCPAVGLGKRPVNAGPRIVRKSFYGLSFESGFQSRYHRAAVLSCPSLGRAASGAGLTGGGVAGRLLLQGDWGRLRGGRRGDICQARQGFAGGSTCP